LKGIDALLTIVISTITPRSYFLLQDEFKERPTIASAINSITNYSSTIPQTPGDPDAKPVEKERGLLQFLPKNS
jgi:hypothetical protein